MQVFQTPVRLSSYFEVYWCWLQSDLHLSVFKKKENIHIFSSSHASHAFWKSKIVSGILYFLETDFAKVERPSYWLEYIA